MAVILFKDTTTLLISDEKGDKLKKALALRPITSIQVEGRTILTIDIDKVMANDEYERSQAHPPTKASENIRANLRALKETGIYGTLGIV